MKTISMNIRNIVALWFFVVFPVLALAQTSAKPLQLVFEASAIARQSPSASSPAASPSIQVLPCRFRVNAVSDLRRNTETMGASIFMFGHSGGTPVNGVSILGGNVIEWTQGAVKAYSGAGLDLRAQGGTESSGGFDLGVRLAHVWTADLNMNAHVVLEASNLGTQMPGSAARRYHGYATKLNWANGDSEYVLTLNMALADAFKGLISGLAPECK